MGRSRLGVLAPDAAIVIGVLVAVPWLILNASGSLSPGAEEASAGEARFWIASALAVVGLFFSFWSVSLFASAGDGTPLPWEPPKRLVVRGPYRYVRNPMLTGVLLALAAEAIWFWSPGLVCWLAAFFAAMAAYVVLVEEPALAERFGDDYELFRQNVPRWSPRLSPWDAPG